LAEVTKELSRRCFYCNETGWVPCENRRRPECRVCAKCGGNGYER